MQKKTIIAVAVAALMTGAAWADGTTATPQYAGEGAPITFTDESVDSKEKIIGGWNYTELGSGYDHADAGTDITLKAGKYDELIGGSHIKLAGITVDEDKAPLVKIGGTKVTMTGGTVSYAIGGSKANQADKTTLTTADVSLTISGGSLTGQQLGPNGDDAMRGNVSVVGGNAVKSRMDSNVNEKASVTTSEVGAVQVEISGGTLAGAVIGGSLADNYTAADYSPVSESPRLKITTKSSAVRITGGTFNESTKSPKMVFGVFGGSAALGHYAAAGTTGSTSVEIEVATDKTVSVDGRVVGGDLVGFGGKGEAGASASIAGGSSVAIKGAGTITVKKTVIGGSFVHLSRADEDVNAAVTGGSSVVVDAAGAKINDEVVGGHYIRQSVNAKESNATATLDSAKVVVKAGEIAENVNGGGKVNGLFGTLRNTVTGDSAVEIQSGKIGGLVVGGVHVKTGQGATISATGTVGGGSTVTMTGGEVHGVVGAGLSHAYGTKNGADWKGTTSVAGKSQVEITGGTVNSLVYKGGNSALELDVAVVGGGLAWNYDGEDKAVMTASAGDASVVIAGKAAVMSDVVGGGYAAGTGSSASVKTTDVLIANATIGSDAKKASVYAGGYADENAVSSTVETAKLALINAVVTGDVHTGASGKATVKESSAYFEGATVKGELNFAAGTETAVEFRGANTVGSVAGTAADYVFTAEAGQKDAVLTVGENGQGSINLTGAKRIRAAAGVGQTLVAGKVTSDKDAVVTVETGFGEYTYTVGALTDVEGLSITADGRIQAGEKIFSGQGRATTATKTLSEAFVGSVAFVNQGAEFIADEGLAAVSRAAAGASGFTAFGTVQGGESRYETGSYVKLRGTSLAAGAAGRVGDAVIAGFVEAGWATSDSHVGGARGDADHGYYGLGAAVRWQAAEAFHLDGSVRLGSAPTDYDGVFGAGTAHYESDAFYATAHVGGGWTVKFAPAALELYGRYALSYLDGDDVGLNSTSGETLSMDSTVTHAVRVGGRLTGAFTETTSWKAGLAYEHVFDGDAEATVRFGGTTAALDAPSLSGDTGILELGLTVKPSAASPWSGEIGLKGYAGDRRGVAGGVSVLYAF